MRQHIISRNAAIRQQKQTGLTLAETLMVIAIGAVAIVSGTLLFINAMTGQRIQTAINGLQALRTEVSGMYGTRHAIPSGDLTSVLVSGGQVPANMTDGEAITHSWDGAVTVTGAGSHFSISYHNLPGSICTQLFARTAAEGGGLVEIGIGGSTQQAPFDPAFAANNCAETGNVVTWTYQR